MKGQGKAQTKKRWKPALLVVAVCCCAAAAALFFYARGRMDRIPELSFQEALAYTTKGREDAVITVGVIQNGAATYTVYGEDAVVLPQALHTYEIGSLTKTFTAALIGRAAAEGKLELDATVDRYLALPAGNEYPTLRALLTHTSGCKPYYFAWPMVKNFLTGRNSFYGVTEEMLLQAVYKLDLPGEASFNYSNFGYALLGLVLESVYGREYTALVNEFAQELRLPDTHISRQDGDLSRYWDWQSGDAYLPAGGLTSNIADMLAYARLQLEESGYIAACHEPLEKIDATSEAYSLAGIHLDEIGMAWILDRENGIVWHNGGTGDFNCYLGFCPETDTAVIVLSNLPPDYRIPATILGVKLFAELD